MPTPTTESRPKARKRPPAKIPPKQAKPPKETEGKADFLEMVQRALNKYKEYAEFLGGREDWKGWNIFAVPPSPEATTALENFVRAVYIYAADMDDQHDKELAIVLMAQVPGVTMELWERIGKESGPVAMDHIFKSGILED